MIGTVGEQHYTLNDENHMKKKWYCIRVTVYLFVPTDDLYIQQRNTT
jgi:hypothetical protein